MFCRPFLLLYFSFFLAAFPVFSYAQNWFEPDYRWSIKAEGGWNLPFDFEVVFGGDTILHGMDCRKWNLQNHVWTTTNTRITYSEGPKAFVYNAALDSFIKMYDFSLSVGDLISIPMRYNMTPGVFKYRIDSIDIVLAGDFSLKRQRVRFIKDSGEATQYTFDILENIGMVGRFFDSAIHSCAYIFMDEYKCNASVDGINYNFECFSSNAGGFHPYAAACSVLGIHDPGGSAIKIFPNPATKQCNLQSNTAGIKEVLVFDLFGKNVLHKSAPYQSQELMLDTSNLPAGMYSVHCVLENGNTAAKKLVIIQ